MNLRLRIYNLRKAISYRYLIPFFRKSRFLSNLYYAFISNAFGREHQRVLNGIYLHRKLLKRGTNVFHFRRQIHRLEKGLIMKEVRDLFALDYIGETVKTYNLLCEKYSVDQQIDKDLLVWSSSVLHKYFNIVGYHPKVEEAKSSFYEKKHKVNITYSIDNHIPYEHNRINPITISYDQFYNLTVKRRSVRWYMDKKVSREKIEKAVLAASMSPSACNRQPFEFRIFDDEEKKNLIGSLSIGIKEFYKNIPVLIAIVGKLSAYTDERDRHVIYIDGGLAAMSFMLALETLGLSSVPINWPDIEKIEYKMEKALNLDIDERPILLIGIGYADSEGRIPYSQKKSFVQLSRYN
ncbi:MAG: nitroreductase family protein [Cyclobacteriaceae bacterium]